MLAKYRNMTKHHPCRWDKYLKFKREGANNMADLVLYADDRVWIREGKYRGKQGIIEKWIESDMYVVAVDGTTIVLFADEMEKINE